MQRVYQVESNTFMNYKFREVMRLFDALLVESSRIAVCNNIMPHITHQFTQYHFKMGLLLLMKKDNREKNHKLKRCFRVWAGRKTPDLKRLIVHLQSNSSLRV